MTKKKLSSTDSDEEVEKKKKENECHGCSKQIEGRRTEANFIRCHDCHDPYHLACATKGKTFSVFVCKNCDSEYSSEEVDEAEESDE